MAEWEESVGLMVCGRLVSLNAPAAKLIESENQESTAFLLSTKRGRKQIEELLESLSKGFFTSAA